METFYLPLINYPKTVSILLFPPHYTTTRIFISFFSPILINNMDLHVIIEATPPSTANIFHFLLFPKIRCHQRSEKRRLRLQMRKQRFNDQASPEKCATAHDWSKKLYPSWTFLSSTKYYFRHAILASGETFSHKKVRFWKKI